MRTKEKLSVLALMIEKLRQEIKEMDSVVLRRECPACRQINYITRVTPCPNCGEHRTVAREDNAMGKDMTSTQIENMLNSSGSAITPETLADSGMFTVTESKNGEWTIMVGMDFYKIKKYPFHYGCRRA